MNMITQTQISAYERCKRFYYLKMIRKLVWPVETGRPENIREGEDFHLLVQQLILGFPPEMLIIPEKNEDVKRWLETYLKEKPLGKPEHIFAEKEVSASFADVLWLGKFDALAIEEDRLIIFDWKTGKAKPDPEHYRGSPQTRLYRFLAKTCSPRLIGAAPRPIPAENIEMVYWFPEHPAQTIRLPYSEEAYRQDMTYLKTRAHEMSSANEADFPMTEKTRQCEHCSYRTYCFPGQFRAELFTEEIPEEEEIFQTELFPMEFPMDTDREEQTF